jgi:hypothetical protein
MESKLFCVTEVHLYEAKQSLALEALLCAHHSSQGCGQDSTGSEKGPMASSCEQSNELLSSTKGGVTVETNAWTVEKQARYKRILTWVGSH